MKRADVAKASFDVIINATPVGMGTNRQSPLEDKELNTKYLFDLVYVPAQTKLIKMARAKNIEVIPGLEMFVQQGARQFEIWTGKPSPIAEMSFVVSKALERMAPPEEELPALSVPDGNGAKPAAKPIAAKQAAKPTAKPVIKPVPAKKEPSAQGKAKAKVTKSKPAKKAAKKTVKR